MKVDAREVVAEDLDGGRGEGLEVAFCCCVHGLMMRDGELLGMLQDGHVR